MFERRILAVFPFETATAEDVELALIDAGALDTSIAENNVEAVVAPDAMNTFLEKMKLANYTPSRTELVAIPKTTIALDEKERARAETLIELLEDHPDVNEVWTNVAEV